MKILLPPSETKRPGGDLPALRLGSLSLPSLEARREAVIDALVDLAGDEDASRRVLKLSARQVGDVLHNRELRTAPTMAAVDRYTGVLYDALDAPGLDAASRAHLHEHVLIHSAPFGPIAALDPIPMYRLAAGASLPGVAPLRRHWADAATRALAEENAPFVLDLRSEAYVALGPIPASVPSAYVRVVTEADGAARALNHFNKKAKGAFVRAFAEDRVTPTSARALIDWAESRGIRLRETGDPGIWELVASV
ncbi:YaaA family protein [Microbacterium sp. NPDC056234]|uniref:YaaA family protein n=1 Tax=Microbacterium sp. NPDC056234 TaxID=3345757 RepID=UPI0035DB026E